MVKYKMMSTLLFKMMFKMMFNIMFKMMLIVEDDVEDYVQDGATCLDKKVVKSTTEPRVELRGHHQVLKNSLAKKKGQI